MGTQQFCLRWNNHQTNLLAVFDQLLQNEAFVDVTLACEGLSIKAHKMVLSACSPYFQSLFIDNPCQHPIVILKDVRFSELKAVVDFMYKGEVNVSQDQLSALLKTAETLKVKGLAEVTGSSPSGDVTRSALGSAALSSGQGPGGGGGGGGSSGGGTLPAGASDGRLSPPAKRKRRLTKRPSTEDGDLEVVESLVDVVTDGPSSVPTTQERTLDGGVTSMKSDTVDTQGVTPTTQTDQPHNATAEMNYDGVNQEHTSNSRDSGMMLVDHAQSSSSSSIGQLPATASTSRMSPAQALIESSPEVIPVKDEPFDDLAVSVSPITHPQSTGGAVPQQLLPSVVPVGVPSAVPSTSASAGAAAIPAIPGTSAGSSGLRFPCPFCPKVFCWKSGLQYHQNVHLERFKCDICGKCWESNALLLQHRDTHLPPDMRPKHICPLCDKQFNSMATLQFHRRQHAKEAAAQWQSTEAQQVRRKKI